jgi:hypothetical protein
MNENPWRVESVAGLQRERVQEEMRQIRMEEKALQARERRPGLLLRGWVLLRAWVSAPRKQAAVAVPPAAIDVRAQAGPAHS